MKQIEMMIIGAQKAGTTSLARYLAEHPLLVEPLCMEFAWFTDPSEEKEDLEAYMGRHFPPNSDPEARFVAKMSNLYCSEQGLRRLYEHNPECLLVMILRDPVERAYSAYRMACYDGWMTYRSRYFEELLTGTDASEGRYPAFIRYGWYAAYLRSVYKVFPKEQVVLIRFEDLEADPQRVCDLLCDRSGLERIGLKGKERVHNETRMAKSARAGALLNWLRVERNPLKRALRAILPYSVYLRLAGGLQRMNRSNTAFPTLGPDAGRLLAEHYAPHDHDLSMLTGLDLSAWASQRG